MSTIKKLPPPSNVKGIRSFLDHVGFYRRFIEDFSKIVKPLCNLLEKDTTFVFYESCLRAFEMIKEKPVSTLIVIIPHWSEPFEIMCDASGNALGAILGQKRENMFKAVYYSSRTLNDA